jgi:hypothetical protein
LRYEHAIERIAVVMRQRGHDLGVPEGDRQLIEAACDDARLEALGQFQLAERDL